MTFTTKYNVGDKLYFLARRDARISQVCGACEGARSFPVKHADGETYHLFCAKCNGKGKIDDGKSVPVYDVKSLGITGVTIKSGNLGMYNNYLKPHVVYHGVSGGSVVTVETEGSANQPWDGGRGALFWVDKSIAVATAAAWTTAAQAAEAVRRR